MPVEPQRSGGRSSAALKWALAALLGLVLMATVAGLATPLSTWWLKRALDERGWHLEAGRSKLRWGTLSFEDAKLGRPRGLRVKAQLDRLALHFSLSGLDLVTASGGTVSLEEPPPPEGPPATEADSAGKPGRRPDSLPRISLEHLSLDYRSAPKGRLEVADLHLEYDGKGAFTLTADRVQGSLDRSSFLLQAPALELSNKARTLLVEKLKIKRAESKLLVLEPPAPEEPEPDSAAPPAPPPLLALRRKLEALTARLDAHLAEQGSVTIDELHLVLGLGEQELGVGPNQLSLRRNPEGFTLEAKASGPLREESTRLELSLALPKAQAARALAKISGGPLSLAELGVKPGQLGLSEVRSAMLQLELELGLGPEQASFDGSAELYHLTLDAASWSKERISNLSLFARARGSLKLDSSMLSLEAGELRLGQIRLLTQATLERSPQHLALAGDVKLPLITCQAVFSSLPAGLVPHLGLAKLSGTLTLDASFEASTKELDKARVDWTLKNDCRFSSIDQQLSPSRFQRPFVHEVPGPGTELLEFETGPGTEAWTELAQIPPYLIAAVLVSEDGNFFRHQGFDHRALQRSLVENLKARRFVRGGSTISMQLAKNLYLKREKTLSRKLEEAFFTLLLEQQLSKEELLELYLNVIEYGPGVYGLRQASRYYFELDPSQLSIAQAFFLASILPSPKQARFSKDGSLKPHWASYLRQLMRIAHRTQRLTEGELQAGLSQEVRLAALGPPPSPLASPPPSPPTEAP